MVSEFLSFKYLDEIPSNRNIEYLLYEGNEKIPSDFLSSDVNILSLNVPSNVLVGDIAYPLGNNLFFDGNTLKVKANLAIESSQLKGFIPDIFIKEESIALDNIEDIPSNRLIGNNNNIITLSPNLFLTGGVLNTSSNILPNNSGYDFILNSSVINQGFTIYCYDDEATLSINIDKIPMSIGDRIVVINNNKVNDLTLANSETILGLDSPFIKPQESLHFIYLDDSTFTFLVTHTKNTSTNNVNSEFQELGQPYTSDDLGIKNIVWLPALSELSFEAVAGLDVIITDSDGITIYEDTDGGTTNFTQSYDAVTGIYTITFVDLDPTIDGTSLDWFIGGSILLQEQIINGGTFKAIPSNPSGVTLVDDRLSLAPINLFTNDIGISTETIDVFFIDNTPITADTTGLLRDGLGSLQINSDSTYVLNPTYSFISFPLPLVEYSVDSGVTRAQVIFDEIVTFPNGLEWTINIPFNTLTSVNILDTFVTGHGFAALLIQVEGITTSPPVFNLNLPSGNVISLTRDGELDVTMVTPFSMTVFSTNINRSVVVNFDTLIPASVPSNFLLENFLPATQKLDLLSIVSGTGKELSGIADTLVTSTTNPDPYTTVKEFTNLTAPSDRSWNEYVYYETTTNELIVNTEGFGNSEEIQLIITVEYLIQGVNYTTDVQVILYPRALEPLKLDKSSDTGNIFTLIAAQYPKLTEVYNIDTDFEVDSYSFNSSHIVESVTDVKGYEVIEPLNLPRTLLNNNDLEEYSATLLTNAGNLMTLLSQKCVSNIAPSNLSCSVGEVGTFISDLSGNYTYTETPLYLAPPVLTYLDGFIEPNDGHKVYISSSEHLVYIKINNINNLSSYELIFSN